MFPKKITCTICLFLQLFAKNSSHLNANTSYCLYALFIYLKFPSVSATPLFMFPKKITCTICLFLHLFTKNSSHLYANTSYCLYDLFIYLKFSSLSANPLFMFAKKSLVLFVFFSI